MADERPPLAHELTTKAKAEGIEQMQAYLTRRSGRARTREDARSAFENLLGFYATVCEWSARAALEDEALAAAHARTPEPAPRASRRKKGSHGHTATTTE